MIKCLQLSLECTTYRLSLKQNLIITLHNFNHISIIQKKPEKMLHALITIYEKLYKNRHLQTSQ